MMTQYHVALVARDGTRKVIADGFTSLTVAQCWALSHQHLVFEPLIAEPAYRSLRPRGMTRSERAGLS